MQQARRLALASVLPASTSLKQKPPSISPSRFRLMSTIELSVYRRGLRRRPPASERHLYAFHGNEQKKRVANAYEQAYGAVRVTNLNPICTRPIKPNIIGTENADCEVGGRTRKLQKNDAPVHYLNKPFSLLAAFLYHWGRCSYRHVACLLTGWNAESDPSR